MRLTLTKRELEVLKMLANGLMSKQIAWNLELSIKTIERHREKLCERLGAKTSAHAVAIAFQNGLLTEKDIIPF